MKLERAYVENFRAIRSLDLPLDPRLTVLHGLNGQGKTSVLSALAIGLGAIPAFYDVADAPFFADPDFREGTDEAYIRMRTTEGLAWERGAVRGRRKPRSLVHMRSEMLRGWLPEVRSDRAVDSSDLLPVVAYYDTERAVLPVTGRKPAIRARFERLDAYEGALSTRPSFRQLVEWFYLEENRELRQQKEYASFGYELPELRAVRAAITSMLPDVGNPRTLTPLRLVVTRRTNGHEEQLGLDQLSGGYRVTLALAADLARRLVQANPSLREPLKAEAVVLIDEVELHLHPAWQQRVLGDLMRTFPGAQFIVSTHSPQVLTTVEPWRIVHLRAGPHGVEAEQETAPTYGAEAGDVLTAAMDVPERPPQNPFVEKLSAYRSLVDANQGEAPQAKALRAELEELSPEDPALAAADVDIRRGRLLRDLAQRA